MLKSIIHTPTNNIKTSLDFYQRLNFKILDNPEYQLVTDGRACIEINPDRHARAGVKLFNDSWGSEVSNLKEITSIIRIKTGYMLADPSGAIIYLIERDSNIKASMDGNCFSTLGNFAGISLETIDVSRSVDIWRVLGFEHNSGSIEQGWLSLIREDGMVVSLMKPNTCPHLFFNPSMTYFNGGKNLPIIEKIKNAGISLTEEITQFNDEGIVDNVIIRDPGGYGFFIFND